MQIELVELRRPAMPDDSNRDTTVVNVAVLMDRFDRHDKDIQMVEQSLRDIDRGQQSMRSEMATIAGRMEQAMDLARNIETSTTAKVAALDLRLTAVQADMANRFATVKSDVDIVIKNVEAVSRGKVSTASVVGGAVTLERTILLVAAVIGALELLKVLH